MRPPFEKEAQDNSEMAYWKNGRKKRAIPTIWEPETGYIQTKKESY